MILCGQWTPKNTLEPIDSGKSFRSEQLTRAIIGVYIDRNVIGYFKRLDLVTYRDLVLLEIFNVYSV